MFGKIKFISGNVAHVETTSSAEELGDFGGDSQGQIESPENEPAPESEQEDDNSSESDTPF